MGRRKQRPVSCTLCRVRKLRCSRVFPCSNCTTRGVVCQNEGAAHDTPIAKQPNHGVSLPKDLSTSELLSRLERLESLVASQAEKPAQAQPIPGSPTSANPRVTSDPESGSALGITSQLQHLTKDVLQVETLFSGRSNLDYVLADTIVFRIYPVRFITKPSAVFFEADASPSSIGAANAIKCIWLPRREEMHVLMQKYLSDVSYFHHVFHRPSMFTLIDATYSGLEQGNQENKPHIGAILLLLSICTITTCAWTAFDDSRCLFASAAEAKSQTHSWLKASLDVADHVHRVAHASLECVQGMIILFYAFSTLEGLSPRSRAMLASAIAMARELGLHRIDYGPKKTLNDAEGANTVKAEISRRVWWYLASMDWMMAQFSIPQEGTYTIHSNQIAVMKPRNVDDEELINGRNGPDHPREHHTCVSYLRERIRLEEVSHDILDCSPFIGLRSGGQDYQMLRKVDTMLRKYLAELPSFFSFDDSEGETFPAGDSRRAPSVTMQRYTLNFLVHRQICKLHMPYLTRGITETPFASARRKCLESARKIIRAAHRLRKENMPNVSLSQRTHVLIRSVFIATTALVLDASLGGNENNVDAGDGGVADAWRILDMVRHEDPLASRFLELSVHFVRENTPNHPAVITMKHITMGRANATPFSGVLPSHTNPTESTSFEQQWQALQATSGLDAVDWERLFGG